MVIYEQIVRTVTVLHNKYRRKEGRRKGRRMEK